jgi:hypothetical protein
LFVLRTVDRAVVSVQHPVIISDRSVPQSDLAVLRARADDYSGSHPRVPDVLLVVEVSDSTLAFDLRIKVPSLVAEAGQSVACVALPEVLVDVRELFSA